MLITSAIRFLSNSLKKDLQIDSVWLSCIGYDLIFPNSESLKKSLLSSNELSLEVCKFILSAFTTSAMFRSVLTCSFYEGLLMFSFHHQTKDNWIWTYNHYYMKDIIATTILELFLWKMKQNIIHCIINSKYVQVCR